MFIDLYKVSMAAWAVSINNDTNVFPTIEDVCPVLENLGVNSDHIDDALMSMTAHLHCRARFDVDNGNFIMTDNVKLNEQVGTA